LLHKAPELLYKASEGTLSTTLVEAAEMKVAEVGEEGGGGGGEGGEGELSPSDENHQQFVEVKG